MTRSSRRAFLSRSAANGLLWVCDLAFTSCKGPPADLLGQKGAQGPGGDRIAEKAKQIIIELLGVKDAEVTPSARLKEDLGADSLDVVELVMVFEEAFDLEIPSEDCEKYFVTVKSVTEYIRSRVKERAAPKHP